MKDSTRLIATLIIWIAAGVIIDSSITSPVGAISQTSDGTLFGIIVVIAFAAMISTIAIWLAGWRAAALMRGETEFSASKQKRLIRERLGQDRLARLIEQLDDEDVYDLEALLLAREGDGELPRQRPRQ